MKVANTAENWWIEFPKTFRSWGCPRLSGTVNKSDKILQARIRDINHATVNSEGVCTELIIETVSGTVWKLGTPDSARKSTPQSLSEVLKYFLTPIEP